MNGIELSILDFIQNMRCGFLDMFFSRVTALGNAGIIWIALTVLFLVIPKYRCTGIVMAFALVIDLLCCNIIIKPLVARIRPYDVNTAIELIIPKQTDYSFPSGHTAASFAAVGAMYYTKNRYWKPAAVLAVIISFSRLYLYVHYPTDVLCGAIFGTAFGYAAFKIVQKKIKTGKTD